jgi:hypothetical protein
LFYPAEQLSDDINAMLRIFRMSQNKDLFQYANLKRRFDGYVFVKTSEVFANAERVPLGYQLRFFSKKRKDLGGSLPWEIPPETTISNRAGLVFDRQWWQLCKWTCHIRLFMVYISRESECLRKNSVNNFWSVRHFSNRSKFKNDNRSQK